MDDEQDGLSKKLATFDAYMRDAAGSAETTRRQRGLIVGRFLAQTFGADFVDVTKIDTVAMRRFVMGKGRDWGIGAVRVAGSSISGYLKYRQICGDKVSKLLHHIPRAAHWRLASIPETLSPAQTEAFYHRSMQIYHLVDGPMPWSDVSPILAFAVRKWSS